MKYLKWPSSLGSQLCCILALVVILFLPAVSGCVSAGQNQVAIQIGSGEAVGTNLLKKNSANGIVNATYLTQYESEIPNVAGLMQGKITPADLKKILSAESTAGLSADKLSVVGLLNGVSSEWIKVNQGTPEGSLVDAAAKNFSYGMTDAVGLVTGTNYVPSS